MKKERKPRARHSAKEKVIGKIDQVFSLSEDTKLCLRKLNIIELVSLRDDILRNQA